MPLRHRLRAVGACSAMGEFILYSEWDKDGFLLERIVRRSERESCSRTADECQTKPRKKCNWPGCEKSTMGGNRCVEHMYKWRPRPEVEKR